MAPVITTVVEDVVQDDVLDLNELERAWHGPDNTTEKSAPIINNAQLSVIRDTAGDFQDRQVYLYVDGELWEKVKYGRPVTREIPPGHHAVRAFNTLFSHTIEINALPGEHVRLRCSNGLSRGSWIMMALLQIAPLSVRLERY